MFCPAGRPDGKAWGIANEHGAASGPAGLAGGHGGPTPTRCTRAAGWAEITVIALAGAAFQGTLVLAEQNPEDAATIVLDHDETGAQQEHRQIRMMGEVARLTAGSDGTLDPTAYTRTVEMLLSAGRFPASSAVRGKAGFA